MRNEKEVRVRCNGGDPPGFFPFTPTSGLGERLQTWNMTTLSGKTMSESKLARGAKYRQKLSSASNASDQISC